MVKTQIFSQTYPCRAGAHYSSGPKTAYFGSKTQIASQGPVLREWPGKKGNPSPAIFWAHFLFGSKIKTTYPGVHSRI